MLMRRERPELRARRNNLQVHRARAIVGPNDFHWTRSARAVGGGIESGQKFCELLDRVERRRKPNPRRTLATRRAHEALQPLERHREMRSALVPRKRVQLIDNNVSHRRELGAKPRRGEQQEQRLGCGNKDLRRPLEHRAALARRSIAGAQAGANHAEIDSGGSADLANAVERLIEVQSNIVSKSFEWRDVEDGDRVGKSAAFGLAHKTVDRPHESRERLAAARGRAQEHVVARARARGANYRPSEFLRARGTAEAPREPLAHRGMEICEHRMHRDLYNTPVRGTAAGRKKSQDAPRSVVDSAGISRLWLEMTIGGSPHNFIASA